MTADVRVLAVRFVTSVVPGVPLVRRTIPE